MAVSSPIGVFDSGVGGLSILEKIHQLLPDENLLYVADSLYAPYGQKKPELIQSRCQSILDFFIEQKVKAVVIACNTATASAVEMLRENYTLPIIGMEPALKPAAQQSHSGVVGVLATVGTIDSEKFLDLRSQYSDQVEIITVACPGLVDKIEEFIPRRQSIIELLENYTSLFTEKGGDTLVLGCTHYSLITDLISEVVGEEVKIIDTGSAVANEVQRRLREKNLENVMTSKVGNSISVEFYSSGDTVQQQKLISHYWGKKINVNLLAC